MISPEAVEPKEVTATQSSAANVVMVPIPQTLSSLKGQVADLRDRVKETNAHVEALDHQINARDLERRSHFKVREDMPALLEQLSRQWGMAWNDIALCVGVSGQAVRKWRKGEPASGPNRLSVATLAAFVGVLSELAIKDPASWLEVPIVSGYPIRGLDLYAAGRLDLLLEWANMRIPDGSTLLTAFDPDWRTTYHREYETFVAGDGNLSIRGRA